MQDSVLDKPCVLSRDVVFWGLTSLHSYTKRTVEVRVGAAPVRMELGKGELVKLLAPTVKEAGCLQSDMAIRATKLMRYPS